MKTLPLILLVSGCLGPLLPLPPSTNGAHATHCRYYACPDVAATVGGSVISYDYVPERRICRCYVEDWRHLASVVEVKIVVRHEKVISRGHWP